MGGGCEVEVESLGVGGDIEHRDILMGVELESSTQVTEVKGDAYRKVSLEV